MSRVCSHIPRLNSEQPAVATPLYLKDLSLSFSHPTLTGHSIPLLLILGQWICRRANPSHCNFHTPIFWHLHRTRCLENHVSGLLAGDRESHVILLDRAAASSGLSI